MEISIQVESDLRIQLFNIDPNTLDLASKKRLNPFLLII